MSLRIKIYHLSIPNPNGNETKFKYNVVDAAVTPLSGLDALKRENFVVNVGDLKLEHNDRKIPMKDHKNY